MDIADKALCDEKQERYSPRECTELTEVLNLKSKKNFPDYLTAEVAKSAEKNRLFWSRSRALLNC